MSNIHCLPCHRSHCRLTCCRVCCRNLALTSFAPVITTLANLSLQSEESFLLLQESPNVTTAEEARTRKFIAGELQANLKPVYSLKGVPEASVDSSASTSAELCQLQLVPVSLQEGAFHWACTAQGSWQCLHGSQWQICHSPDQPWLVSSVWCSQPWHTTEWLQSEFGVKRNTTPWLQLYLEGQTHFFPFGSASVTSVKLEVGIPQGSVLGPLFVICCSLVEMSSQTMVFPTISKPITSSSTSPWLSTVTDYHSGKIVCSCCVYWWHQIVVPADLPAAQPEQVGGSNSLQISCVL